MYKKTPVIITIVFVSFLFATSFSCGKQGNTACTGGKGGGATLLVVPEAHGTFLDSCTIYIKYAANDLPSNGVYDDSNVVTVEISGVDTTPIAAFRNLKPGCYYVFGMGYHKGYAQPFVKGGVPYNIQQNDSERIYLPTYAY